ncbi:MAG: hypothetical protein ABR543_18270 [Gemmatimonadaceae bacterium]
MTPLGVLWRDWRVGRQLRANAEAYVDRLLAEPDEDDVRWLAREATGDDLDHARWELRYARRSMGLLTAQRDALDDRTGSAVARELGEVLGRDPAVAPGKLLVAETQFNVRIRAYTDALANREGAGSVWHLGRTLLRFAGSSSPSSAEMVARASEIVSSYLAEANAALRDIFGTASLPEDVLPSTSRT